MKSRLLPLAVFLVSLAVYVASTRHLIDTVRWPTGDEPYYLLIAHSLVHDGDFELSNNFDNRDYLAFYPGELYPRHEAVTPKPILVSKHALGVPLLIAPGYALDGWAGAALTLNLIGALLALNLFWLARDVTGSRRIALAVWLALAFATPFFTYAELVFPEAPAALLIVYAYRTLRDARHAGARQRLLAAACLAALPWLHPRFLFVVAGFGCWMAAQEWARMRGQAPWRALWARLPALLPGIIVLLGSAALFTAYNLYVYESPFPNYADHSGSGSAAEIIAGFFGVWLDQQWGLLNHAPVYLLALAAVPCLRRGRALRGALGWPLTITLPYFILIVQYRYWWGEWCPPARYLAPLLPLLAHPLALALARWRTFRFRSAFGVLAAAGWLVSLSFGLDGRLMYNQPLGQSVLLAAWSRAAGIDLTRLEPSFIAMFLKDFDPLRWTLTQVLLTGGWIAALALVAAYAFGWARWPPLARASDPARRPAEKTV
jgi:thiol-disulfide isomerase/thioredoxin